MSSPRYSSNQLADLPLEDLPSSSRFRIQILHQEPLKAEYEDKRQDYSAEQLMLLPENKYKNMKQAGKWDNLSEAEAEIVALNANIEVLKLKGMKKPEGKAKKEENKQEDENKKEQKKTEKKKADFHWHKPRANQMKTVDGKDHYWCPNHQNKITKEWGQRVWHKPEDCNNKQQKNQSKVPTPKPQQ